MSFYIEREYEGFTGRYWITVDCFDSLPEAEDRLAELRNFSPGNFRIRTES